MKRSFAIILSVLMIGLHAGCAYLVKPDLPPPLPPIEEVKPPFKLRMEHFKEFPWGELPKPAKDGNEPNSKLHTWREGDTFESVAETEMGTPAWGPKLGAYNDADAGKLSPGDKIVIPNPIIGISSTIVIKRKGEKEFGASQSFDTELKKGDEFKFHFESNVNAFLYVFREGAKGVDMVYPAQVKRGKRNKKAEPLIRDTGKITAREPKLIPSDAKGMAYDPKRIGDRVFVFLSLRQIPEFDDLKEKEKIRVEEVEDVMHRVKQGDIISEGANRVLRITDPSEVLGFTLNVNG
jgi:hypothetical protein